MEKEIIELLEKYNQHHIVEHMKKLNEEEKQKIIAQIKNVDFEEIESLYNKTQTPTEIKKAEIEPLQVIVASELKQNEDYIKTGENVIKQNKFAVVTMAGGQGTRLGHNGPKGSFKIELNSQEKYLFEIIIDQLIEANKKYHTEIPYYVMTSEENNDETVAFFEKMNYFGYPKQMVKFFKQAEAPLISKKGKLLIGEDNLIKFASNGNGEIYKSMIRKGIVEDMKQKQVEWILITGIDNILVKIVDPLFIGTTVKQNHLIASKSIIKREPKEGGGVFTKTDGKPRIIEYVEIPDDIANAKDENGEFVYGDMNFVNHLFNIKALEIIDSRPLPYHTAVKKSTHKDENGNLVQENIYKFEKFIFDAFAFFDDMTLFRVLREEEFAPIKNKEGNDSPETAKKLYEDYTKTLKK